MSCSKEILEGYIKTNVDTRVNVPLNVNHNGEYGVMTVFNKADKTIKVEYTTTDGYPAFCYVPAGQAFTRILHGAIASTSLFLTSIGGASIGDVIINLGNR